MQLLCKLVCWRQMAQPNGFFCHQFPLPWNPFEGTSTWSLAIFGDAFVNLIILHHNIHEFRFFWMAALVKRSLLGFFVPKLR
jgi:hypothetical protein